ncbi:Uncharacterised protein [Bordetella pertussis]|nr:Uncharacterised protein [Bordetella pertussis]
MPSKAALTITASKCEPSPCTSRCSHGSPSAMYWRTCSGVGSMDISS